MRYFIAGGLALLVFPLLSPATRADVSELAGECDQCHGTDGISKEDDVPTIAGISAFVIEDYLLTYQDRGRPCHETRYRAGDLDRPATSMCDIAERLSEEQVSEIAQYYSEKEFIPAKQEFDPAKAAAGAAVHRRACEKCHTDNASNPEDDAGIMAGQWMPYLRQVFADFSSGERQIAENRMREKFEALSDEEKENLVHFYGSLQ